MRVQISQTDLTRKQPRSSMSLLRSLPHLVATLFLCDAAVQHPYPHVIHDIFPPTAVKPLQRAALYLPGFQDSKGENAADFNWLPRGVTPRNLLERAVSEIMDADIKHGLVDGTDVAGASWWVNIFDADEESATDNWHFDQDSLAQNLLNDSTLVMAPLLSTVTYLSSHGGPTGLFLDYDTEDRLSSQAVPSELFLSFPTTNKHLAFSGAFHGVLPELRLRPRQGQVLGDIPQVKGRRVVLAVNLWDYKENIAQVSHPHYGDSFGEPWQELPLHNPLAAPCQHGPADLTAAAEAQAELDRAWTTVELHSEQKPHLKPHVPHALGLHLPHGLMQALQGRTAVLRFPALRRPVLSYHPLAKVVLGVRTTLFAGAGPPSQAPTQEKTRWANFVQASRDTVLGALTRRCKQAKYMPRTACKRLTQGTNSRMIMQTNGL